MGKNSAKYNKNNSFGITHTSVSLHFFVLNSFRFISNNYLLGNGLRTPNLPIDSKFKNATRTIIFEPHRH